MQYSIRAVIFSKLNSFFSPPFNVSSIVRRLLSTSFLGEEEEKEGLLLSLLWFQWLICLASSVFNYNPDRMLDRKNKSDLHSLGGCFDKKGTMAFCVLLFIVFQAAFLMWRETTERERDTLNNLLPPVLAENS